jgi:hypothetical protein
VVTLLSVHLALFASARKIVLAPPLGLSLYLLVLPKAPVAQQLWFMQVMQKEEAPALSPPEDRFKCLPAPARRAALQRLLAAVA